MKYPSLITWIMGIVLCGALQSNAEWIGFSSSTPANPDVKLLSSDNSHVTYEVTLPGIEMRNVMVEGESYKLIESGKSTPDGTTGVPMLLRIPVNLAIPTGATVSVSITPGNTFPLPDMDIAPVPNIEYVEDGGTMKTVETFLKDQTIYTTDAYYPSQSYEIVDRGFFVTQQAVLIYVYPLRYNPVDRILEVIETLTVEVEFFGGAGPAQQDMGDWNSTLAAAFLNCTWSGSRPPASPTCGTVEWVSATNSAFVCDYLIIMPDIAWTSISPRNDGFDEQVQRFADLRATLSGYDVCIVRYGNSPDAIPRGPQGVNEWIAIRNYIQAVFENGTAENMPTGHLGYVLLIGDARDEEAFADPTEMTIGDWLIPTCRSSGQGCDHMIACLTNEQGVYDQLEDICLGRFPVGNAQELTNVVDKIYNYCVVPGDRSWKNEVFAVTGHDGFNEWCDEDHTACDNDARRQMAQNFYRPGFEILHDNGIPITYARAYDLNSGDYQGQPCWPTLYPEPDHDDFYEIYHGCEWSSPEGYIPQTDLDYLNNQLSDGCILWGYYGHGCGNTEFCFLFNPVELFLGEEPIVENSDRLPFVLDLSCRNSWIDPVASDAGSHEYDAFSEIALVKSMNGAIGFVGSGPNSVWYTHGDMWNMFAQHVINPQVRSFATVGEAYRAYKIALVPDGVPPTAELTGMHYMGDPALDLLQNPIGNEDITENATWSRRIVLGNSITVESGATLTIEPGTEVILMNGSQLLIEGRLIAEGTSDERIRIHGEVNSTAGRLRFLNSSGAVPYNILDYCDLYNLEIGIDCNNSTVDLSNSTIMTTANAVVGNGVTIQIESTTVQNSSLGVFIIDGACDLDQATIRDCNLGAVYVRSSGDVTNSTIRNNDRYGAYVIASDTRFTNNEIYDNAEGGVRFWRADGNVLNDNHIHDNGTAHNPNAPDWPGMWVLSGAVTMHCNQIEDNEGPGMILYGQSVASMADGDGMNVFDDNSIARGVQGYDYGQVSLVGGLPMIECGLNTFRDAGDDYWLIRSMYEDMPAVGWDATYNYWGTGPTTGRISNGPVIEPDLDGVWNCNTPYEPNCAVDDEELLFKMGWTQERETQFDDAINTYNQLLAEYPNGKYAKYAVDRIAFCKKAAGYTPQQTRTYFLDLAADSTKDSTLVTLCKANAAWCLVDMGDYSNAFLELDSLLDHEDKAYIRLSISLKLLLAELEEDGYELLGVGGDGTQRPHRNLDSESSREYYQRFESITTRLDSTMLLFTNGRGKETFDESAIPTEYSLYQNYPNPFNPTTQIRYNIPEAVRVQISVYNTLGQLVTQLRDDVQAAGRYTIFWDGKSSNGLDVATGMYIYQIKAGSFVDAKKMLLLK